MKVNRVYNSPNRFTFQNALSNQFKNNVSNQIEIKNDISDKKGDKIGNLNLKCNYEDYDLKEINNEKSEISKVKIINLEEKRDQNNHELKEPEENNTSTKILSENQHNQSKLIPSTNNVQLPFNFSNKTLSAAEPSYKSQIESIINSIKD